MQLILLPVGQPEPVVGRHTEASGLYLAEPLTVAASGVAVPHPDKIAEGAPKAVNRKHEGWGGEDAYFCTDSGCAVPLLAYQLQCFQHPHASTHMHWCR